MEMIMSINSIILLTYISHEYRYNAVLGSLLILQIQVLFLAQS